MSEGKLLLLLLLLKLLLLVVVSVGMGWMGDSLKNFHLRRRRSVRFGLLWCVGVRLALGVTSVCECVQNSWDVIFLT